MITTDLRNAIEPAYFGERVLGFKLDTWQREAMNIQSKRMIYNCCRQSGKSAIAAAKGYHQSVYYPGSLTLLLSSSLRQSMELFRKVTDMDIETEESPGKDEDSKMFMTLKNGSRIISLPGKEGSIRGYSGVNLIIIDESARVTDELYFALRPMLAVSGGSLLLLSTPHGKRGHFYREWEEGGEIWKRFTLTADECPRITKKFLAEEKERMPEGFFMQEYFCEFRELEEQIFSHDLIKGSLVQGDPMFEREGRGLVEGKPLFAAGARV
ncbi:hypothetical protein ES702_04081 [subsurface metagenome]